MAIIQVNQHQPVPQSRTRGFCWSKVLLLLPDGNYTFQLGRRCYSSPQQCYMHLLHAIIMTLTAAIIITKIHGLNFRLNTVNAHFI